MYLMYIWFNDLCFNPTLFYHLRSLYNNNISEIAPETFDGLQNLYYL